jgi:transposase InsO family protein
LKIPLVANQRWSLDFVWQPDTTISDNGTEYTSNAILAWADEASLGWHYIAPGKPQQNGVT